MNTSHAFLAAATLLAFTACESELASDVNQDRIHTVYELFYNADEDITRARATFSLGSETGTRLELTDAATVTFDGEPLQWNDVISFYELEMAGFRQNGTFSYTDLNDETFVNPASITATDFPDDNADIEQGRAYELTWDGPALGDDQTISLTLLTQNAVGNDRLFLEADRGATKIVLPGNDLDNLVSGPATLVLDRFEDSPLAQGTGAEGKVIGHYRAKSVTVMVD